MLLRVNELDELHDTIDETEQSSLLHLTDSLEIGPAADLQILRWQNSVARADMVVLWRHLTRSWRSSRSASNGCLKIRGNQKPVEFVWEVYGDAALCVSWEDNGFLDVINICR